MPGGSARVFQTAGAAPLTIRPSTDRTRGTERQTTTMNQPANTKLQQLLDAFREVRYPGGYPTSRNEDALARRLMSEFKDWCSQQGLAAALEEAEKEAALLEAADELEDSFGELAAEGKARSICVPEA